MENYPLAVLDSNNQPVEASSLASDRSIFDRWMKANSTNTEHYGYLRGQVFEALFFIQQNTEDTETHSAITFAIPNLKHLLDMPRSRDAQLPNRPQSCCYQQNQSDPRRRREDICQSARSQG